MSVRDSENKVVDLEGPSDQEWKFSVEGIDTSRFESSSPPSVAARMSTQAMMKREEIQLILAPRPGQPWRPRPNAIPSEI